MNIPAQRIQNTVLGTLCFLFFNAPAQNLILNPGFEDFNQYIGPAARMLDTSLTNFPGINHWRSPTLHNYTFIQSDSLEIWGGHDNIVHPRTGQAHGWIHVGGNKHRESIGLRFYQSELSTSLSNNCYYEFTFYILPFYNFLLSPSTNPYLYAADGFGAYFSANPIQDTTGSYSNSTHVKKLYSFNHFRHLNINPQASLDDHEFAMDTVNYTEFKKVFKAQGGERYITLGNFKGLENTNFKNVRTGQVVTTDANDSSQIILAVYFVDDLELINIPPPDSLLRVSADTVICPGQTVVLEAEMPDAEAWYWSTGDSTRSIVVTQPGNYTVTGFCPCGQTIQKTINVGQLPQIPAFEVNDTTLCTGENFVVSLPEGPRYFLNDEPVQNGFSLQQQGYYEIRAEYFCDTTTVEFVVEIDACDELVYIPNAFSPNGDGVNDCFHIGSTNLESIHLMVFDRWGNRVYETKNLDFCWDGYFGGSPLSGVFTFSLDYVTSQGKIRHQYGTIKIVH